MLNYREEEKVVWEVALFKKRVKEYKYLLCKLEAFKVNTTFKVHKD